MNKKEKKFLVVGTNSIVSDLQDKSLFLDCFDFSPKETLVRVEFDEKTYIFDLRSIVFNEHGFFLKGFISDEKKNVGRVVMKYLPE